MKKKIIIELMLGFENSRFMVAKIFEHNLFIVISIWLL